MAKFFRHIFLALTLLAGTTARAQEVVVAPAEAVGAAGILSLSATEHQLPSVNPALIALDNGFGAVCTYAIPYELTDLQQVMLKASYKTPIVSVAVNVSKSGSSESNFTRFGGGISRSFGAFGIGFEYYAIIHNLPYNQDFTSSFSRIGIYVKPTDQWTFSVAVQNIERRGFEYEYSTTEIEPVAYAGLKWDGNKLFSLLCEAEKRWDSDPVGKFALALRPIDSLTVTCGYTSKGNSPTVGVGYEMGHVGIHAGISYHEKLGITSAAQLSIRNLWE